MIHARDGQASEDKFKLDFLFLNVFSDPITRKSGSFLLFLLLISLQGFHRSLCKLRFFFFFFFFCRFFVHFFHKVQEPLFNDTVFRYMLQHDLFVGLQQTLIDDVDAVSIVATLEQRFVCCSLVLLLIMRMTGCELLVL
jgi:hypothetical protein